MTATEHTRTISDVDEELKALGVTRVRFEIPDANGNFRGKYHSVEKAISGYRGMNIVDAIYGFALHDDFDAGFETPTSGHDTGFGDAIAVPDWSTLRIVPWDARLGAVICDIQTQAGEPYPLDPRGAVHRACERLDLLGYEARFGVEYELFLFHYDDAAVRSLGQGRPRQLVPASPVRNTLSFLQTSGYADFARDMHEQMPAYGVPLDAIQTECGFGMIEVAIAPADPVEAADRAARFKLGCKELARRHGLLASFIAKWDLEQPGSSAHIHQSVLRNGKNAFWAGIGAMSDVARHYVAGLLATAQEVSAFMGPFPNSYRRYAPGMFSGYNEVWGFDNRNACVRVITSSESSARLEHRRPGADLHPYLSIAACVDGGRHGIEHQLPLGPPSPGRAHEDPSAAVLPTDLPTAVERLTRSELVRGWYGDPIVDHFVQFRAAEQMRCERLRDAQVPDWELSRYIELA
jgi:glutamine synthetase